MIPLLEIFYLVTSVAYVTAGKNCSNSSLPDDALRDVFLHYHNVLRVNVTQQKIREGELESTLRFHKMKWSCGLERKAENTISDCQLNFPSDVSINYALVPFHYEGTDGLNIYAKAIKKAVTGWIKPQHEHDEGTGSAGQSTFTFHNMILSNTSRIGCSFIECSKGSQGSLTMLLVSCLYNKHTSAQQKAMFNDTLCNNNTDCSSIPSSACNEGLCIEYKKDEVTENSLVEELSPTASNKGEASLNLNEDDNLAHCAASYFMNDKLRTKVLNDHNSLRSQTARGLSEDPSGTDGYAPKASRMKKLVYDCTLEASAQHVANNCTFGHSGTDFGESLFMMSPVSDMMGVLDLASSLWFDELRKYGVGPSNVFTDVQVGHYTQIVWDWTERIGCGIRQCSGESVLLVCHYDPAGNYQMWPIYKIGEPCSACDCKNCKCDPDEGLCYKRKPKRGRLARRTLVSNEH